MPRSREAQRADKRKRYYDYIELCAELDVEPQYGRWSTHRRELMNAPQLYRKPTDEEMRQWWRDRYTPEQIRHLAAGLDFLLSEERAAA